jgi:isocitrate dehydrogenase
LAAWSAKPGVAPTAYVGAKAAVFQASAAGPRTEKEGAAELNPTSVLLCGVMLFDHLGWKDSAELVTQAP